MVEIEGLDFSAIRTTAGDLNGADLAAVLEAERIYGIASATLNYQNKKTLVFAASVRQAEMLAEFSIAIGSMAGWAWGRLHAISGAVTQRVLSQPAAVSRELWTIWRRL